MTLAKLNELRARNGKTQLSCWKNGKAKLAEAIAKEAEQSAETASDLTDVEVGQSESQIDQTDPTMPMGENGNSLVDPIERGPEGEKIPRGAINAMCVELLQTEAPYESIVAAIRARFPTARTTARSLASVAMDLRADGLKVPARRKPAKAPAPKTPPQEWVTE